MDFSSRWQRNRSRNERKPTSMEPSHTGRCRMLWVCIRYMASSELVLGATVCRSVLITSAIYVDSGSRPFRHHPSHKVTFGEDADQLRAVKYRNCSHVALHHVVGSFKDGLVRLDVVNGAIAQQVADGRHNALH